MLNQNEKLERFSAQINRTAEKSVLKIKKQTEKISNTQLEQFRAEAQAELEERMAYAKGRLLRDANAAVARHAAGRKQLSSQHREQIVDDVFAQVKSHLQAFVSTDAYRSLLKDCITSLLHSLGKRGAKIYVRAEDEEIAATIAKAIDPDADVVVDSANTLGLARVATADGSIFLSDTFDSRLDAARSRFLAGCGLSILPKEGD